MTVHPDAKHPDAKHPDAKYPDAKHKHRTASAYRTIRDPR